MLNGLTKACMFCNKKVIEGWKINMISIYILFFKFELDYFKILIYSFKFEVILMYPYKFPETAWLRNTVLHDHAYNYPIHNICRCLYSKTINITRYANILVTRNLKDTFLLQHAYINWNFWSKNIHMPKPQWCLKFAYIYIYIKNV